MGYFEVDPTIYNVGAWPSVVLLVIIWLYRRMLPKPIPGIPYNEAAAKHILGDIPAVCQVLINQSIRYILLNQNIGPQMDQRD